MLPDSGTCLGGGGGGGAKTPIKMVHDTGHPAQRYKSRILVSFRVFRAKRLYFELSK